MQKFTYVPLGQNPDAEAYIMRDLCIKSASDPAIWNEFEETIIAYTTQSVPALSDRIATRYYGKTPSHTGDFIALGDEVGGIAFASIKDFKLPALDREDPTEVRGVNVSAWLLKTLRDQGIGRQIIAYATSRANDYIGQPNLPNWRDRKLWTSVRETNIASQKACEHAGFVEAGPHIGREGRLLFLFAGS